MGKRKRKQVTEKLAPGLVDPMEGEARTGCVNCHFLDSGAFTIWSTAASYAKERKCDRWAYYHTDEFFEYMDSYAQFVRDHAIAIDYCANVDVIPDFTEKRDAERAAKLTWRNQRYLEKRGIHPVPVVHFGLNEDKWLTHYIACGYELIGLGGLVGQQTKAIPWIDRCFNLVCDTKNRLPMVKLHGFGVTSYKLMWRYPWFSVDSTSWTKKAAYGYLMVPHKRGGKFVFDKQPYTITISDQMLEHPRDQEAVPCPFHSMAPMERKIVEEWLEHIGIPLGRKNTKGEITEYGVTNRHVERRAANLLFYEEMRLSLPEYPWPFHAPDPQSKRGSLVTGGDAT